MSLSETKDLSVPPSNIRSAFTGPWSDSTTTLAMGNRVTLPVLQDREAPGSPLNADRPWGGPCSETPPLRGTLRGFPLLFIHSTSWCLPLHRLHLMPQCLANLSRPKQQKHKFFTTLKHQQLGILVLLLLRANRRKLRSPVNMIPSKNKVPRYDKPLEACDFWWRLKTPSARLRHASCLEIHNECSWN